MTEVKQTSFDLKTCPMCSKPLALRVPPAGSTDPAKRYICSTHLPGTKISHYHVMVGSIGQMQVVRAWPYVVHNKLNSDKSEVYKWQGNELNFIISLPRISLDDITNEKLTEKIKIYVLFS